MRKLAHWLEEYGVAESEDIYRDLALSHAVHGGQQGAEIARMIRGQRFRQLCEFELDYSSEGLHPQQLYHCRQAMAFFTKLPFLSIGIDKEAAAWEKFQQSEQDCSRTNDVLRKWARGDFQFHPRVESWIFKAQRQIARVLGPVPSWEAVGYRFGSGATTLTKKREASLREKFRAGPACSEDLVPALNAVLAEMPGLCREWADSWVSDSWDSPLSCEELQGLPIPGLPYTSRDAAGRLYHHEEFQAQVSVQIMDGRLDFVTKNARTHRSVCTEPPLNGMVQMAHGDYLFECLARSGLNLRDQTRNQRLALIGSLTGELATLDLVSASDTNARELVYHLLPLDWADRLAKCRTSHVTYKGNRLTLEKFSSMGNGYTFPLESLIFWALTCAVCEEGEVVSVYGDDIICPSHRYADVAYLLMVLGFTVNEKKSFASGPFRESCGKDYYRGIDIRPYYADELVSPRALFTLHNYYVRRLDPERAQDVLRYIHPSLQIWGPDGYGDGHLVSESWRRDQKPRHRRNGWAGYTFDTFTIRGRKDVRPELPGDCVLPSYSVYRRAPETVFDPMAHLVRDRALDERILPSGYSPAIAGLVRGHGSLESVLPIPDVKFEDGSFAKAVSLPLSEGDKTYKRVSIYTLTG